VLKYLKFERRIKKKSIEIKLMNRDK